MKVSKILLYSSFTRGSTTGQSKVPVSRLLLYFLATLCSVLLLSLGLAYVTLSQALPPLSSFAEHYTNRPAPTQIFDRSGEKLLLTLAYEQINGQPLQLCKEDGAGCFPLAFVEAVIAGRDADFREHSGARLSQIFTRHPLSIAEEMVMDAYPDLTGEDSFGRVRLWLLANQVTQYFGRDQIMTWFLNNAWFGQYAFGVDAAAQTYLNKSAADMNKAECVLMSAIIAAPALNPIDSAGAVRNSYLSQLQKLADAAVFSEEEIDSLKSTNFVIYEPPSLLGGRHFDIISQKAVDLAYSKLGQEMVERGGLSIITTEDQQLQNWLNCVTHSADSTPEARAECPLSAAVSAEERELTDQILSRAPVSASVVSVGSGELLASVEVQGDEEVGRSANKALISWQAGSNMSIFTALYAFSMGYSPSSMLWDMEDSYTSAPDGYANPDGKLHGPVSLRSAVVNDYLLPLSALLQNVGSNAVLNQAALFGLSTSGISARDELLFTGSTVSSEGMAYSLLPIASLGKQSGAEENGSMQPISVLEIRDHEGNIHELQPVTERAIIDSGLAWLTNHVLSEDSQVLKWLDRPAGSKISRVSGKGERWMSGYTPQVVCSVRIGKENTETGFIGDDDRIEKAVTVLWRSIMEQSLQDEPVLGWDRPQNITQVRVCLPSGKLPTPSCQQSISEVFLAGNEPLEYDDLYVTRYINKSNQLLATRFTDPSELESKVFIKLPDNAPDWDMDSKLERVPREYDPIPADTTDEIQLYEPEAFSSHSQADGQSIDIKVDITLNTKIKYYQVSSGQGLFPQKWTERCLGQDIEGGNWLLCSIDPGILSAGLNDLRVSIITDEQKFYSTDTYVVIE